MFFLILNCICHDLGSIKQGNLFYQNDVIIVRTRALFQNFASHGLNSLPPTPNTIRIKNDYERDLLKPVK